MIKILISIILNSAILYTLYYFLGESEDKTVQAAIIVEWWAYAFIAGWVILWVLNAIVKPVLNLLALPFFFLFFWVTSLVINWITLWLLEFILNDFLKIPNLSYHIASWFEFIVTVAIFSILNIIYSLILNK